MSLTFGRTLGFGLGLALSTYASALPSLEHESFDSLVTSQEALNLSDSAAVRSEIWLKYQNTVKADTARIKEFEDKGLLFADKKMRFSESKKGQKPDSGYPFYIALHGGGAAGTWTNDSQWEAMKSYYLSGVSTGIYSATRGVTDTWNLHFVDESYPLYDELIQMMIATRDVDPNRVYVLGFSAGGDGVYQIAPRMADRFAAANMSAGHHNWIKFDNLYQTPFLMQVGQNDTAYKRNTVAAENDITLDQLAAERGSYIHDVYVHYKGSHNSWRDNDGSGNPQRILKNPELWLSAQNEETITKDTNAIHWLDQFTRNPYPSSLIWDPKTNAKRFRTAGGRYLTAENETNLSRPNQLFYWLDITGSDLSQESIRIKASYDRATNQINLSGIEGLKRIRVLLRQEMLDLDQAILVTVDGQTLDSVRVVPNLSTMTRTLLERGDPSYQFDAEIILEQTPTWTVRQPVLETPTPPYPYSYCSKDSCRLVRSQPSFFFGQLPEATKTHCKANNLYAMTFDDGPSSQYPEVLSILAEEKVPATFFVLGNHLEDESNQGFLKAAYQAGHQISNHSFSHKDLMKLSGDELLSEVQKTKQRIIEVLGDSPAIAEAASLVRPPFGYITSREQELLEANGFRSVRWNSDRSDWELSLEQSELELKRHRQHLTFIQKQNLSPYNNSIIDLNHDFSPATLKSLRTMIQEAKAAGYRFVTLKDCL